MLSSSIQVKLDQGPWVKTWPQVLLNKSLSQGVTPVTHAEKKEPICFFFLLQMSVVELFLVWVIPQDQITKGDLGRETLPSLVAPDSWDHLARHTPPS